jgi:2-oxoglutarate ferredoxin oxidoreductase subunit gamma
MNIRFSGFGGQGIILAGVIFGHAAILDGKNAVQTQSYGSASRGGACKCDVIISAEEIYELEFPESDVLIALSQQAYEKYGPDLKENGTLIIDKDLVNVGSARQAVNGLSATNIAHNKFGRKIIANMVVLGYLTAHVGIISKEAVIQAICDNVPPGTAELNIKAFEEGYKPGTTESG